MANVKANINSTKNKLNESASGLSGTRLTARENQVKSSVDTLHGVLASNTNFLDFSQNTLDLVKELNDTLSWFTHSSTTVVWFDVSVNNAKNAVASLLSHVRTVDDAHNNIIDEPSVPTIEIWSTSSINLWEYLDLSKTPATELNLLDPWAVFPVWTIPSKSVDIKNKDLRKIRGSDWSSWAAWNRLCINGNNLDVNLGVIAGQPNAIPAWIPTDQYPLFVELDLFYNAWWNAKIKTLPKIKIKIKEPVAQAAVLSRNFTATETYQAAIDGRLNNFYNVNAESIVKEYIWKRIDNAGWNLSDIQKEILIDNIYSDASFLNWDANNAYSMVSLQWFFPDRINDESVGSDNWYENALRKLLINPEQFNNKAKEIILDRLADENKNNAWFLIRDELINIEVNNLIQEQALNSIWNITNNSLPTLLSDFSAKDNDLIRHQNKHKKWFRWFKKLIGIFKWRKRRKLTDISTNNYFSFFSKNTYNISDEVNVAGKKVNQDVKLDINSWNNISASVKVTWDEEANFEFAWASSIYELITWILWNNEVWPVTKVYLTLNIYKQLFNKMHELFWNHNLNIGWDEYKIISKDKLKIDVNWDTVFDEDQFRKLESASDLQNSAINLAEHFNTVMNHQNNLYTKWMTTKNQNKFKIWWERVWRILRKRRNADFNFKTEVEWVQISYEDRKFTVKYEWEEIKWSKIETILSHKIFEWKQIQIMKAIYKEMLNEASNDPKSQALLKKHSGIWFVVEHEWEEYVVSTHWEKMRFGLIPSWFPRANIDTKRWILKWWMFTSISDDEVLTNPKLASILIRTIKWYRRRWIRWDNI